MRFLRVIRSLNLELSRAKFSTWLFRVARKLALNHIRDYRREAGADGLERVAGREADRVEQVELVI